MPVPADLERLREALVELDRLRLHERALRLETEGLLRGMRMLGAAHDADELFDAVVGVLRDLVPFEQAFLVALGGRGGFRVVRSTLRRLLGMRWSPRGLLQRVLDGETVALFDTACSPDWLTLPVAAREAARSAIMVPIRSQAVSGTMVFVHSGAAFFTPAHVHLLKRFTPLIDQALDAMAVRERLEEERLAARLADAGRRKAEAEIRRARDLMESAIGFAPIYLWEIDAELRYVFAEGTAKVLGYTPDELLGRLSIDYFDAQDAPTRAWIGAMMRREPFENVVIRRRCKSGGKIWASVSGAPMFGSGGGFQGYRGITMDVTESTEVKLKLEQMALHDALTGLANRRKFMDRFEPATARMRRSGAPLALLAVDIDHFKRINDAYGHPAGDEVLVAVGRILERTVRRSDLAARFGGEEFMVLLEETGVAGAVEVAEKLREAVAAERFDVESGGRTVGIGVTISVGVAVAERETSFDDLMERADQALYAAKLAGRNRVRVEDQAD